MPGVTVQAAEPPTHLKIATGACGVPDRTVICGESRSLTDTPRRGERHLGRSRLRLGLTGGLMAWPACSADAAPFFPGRLLAGPLEEGAAEHAVGLGDPIGSLDAGYRRSPCRSRARAIAALRMSSIIAVNVLPAKLPAGSGRLESTWTSRRPARMVSEPASTCRSWAAACPGGRSPRAVPPCQFLFRAADADGPDRAWHHRPAGRAGWPFARGQVSPLARRHDGAYRVSAQHRPEIWAWR